MEEKSGKGSCAKSADEESETKREEETADKRTLVRRLKSDGLFV
jgi:hypothetical protein